MITFLDLETSGLPIKVKRNNGHLGMPKYSDLSKFNNARIVQVGYLSYQPFKNGEKEKCFKNISPILKNEGDYIIKPDNFIISPESTVIHKISHNKAMNEGVDIRDVLIELEHIIDNTYLLVMHNSWFDRTILLSEAYRYNNKVLVNKLFETKSYCTMRGEGVKEICGIKSKYHDGYKLPKLSELYQHLYGKTIPKSYQHNAINDARITAKCFFKLAKSGFKIVMK